MEKKSEKVKSFLPKSFEFQVKANYFLIQALSDVFLLATFHINLRTTNLREKMLEENFEESLEQLSKSFHSECLSIEVFLVMTISPRQRSLIRRVFPVKSIAQCYETTLVAKGE